MARVRKRPLFKRLRARMLLRLLRRHRVLSRREFDLLMSLKSEGILVKKEDGKQIWVPIRRNGFSWNWFTGERIDELELA